MSSDEMRERYALTPAEVESLTASARNTGGFVPPDLRGVSPDEALTAIMDELPVLRAEAVDAMMETARQAARQADALTEEEILSTAPSWRPGGLVDASVPPGGLVDKALAVEADFREGLSAEAARRVREARRAAGRSLVETAAPSSPVKVPVRYLGGFGTEDEFTLTRTVTLDWPTGMVFDEVPMLAELIRVALFRTSESEPWAVQSVFVKGRALDGEGRDSGAWGGYQVVIERWRWADGAGPDWLHTLVESVTPGE